VNIFITSTPEVSSDLVNNVCDILNIPGSDLDFLPTTPINISKVNSLNPYFPNVNENTVFTFKDLFYLCGFFRTTKDKSDKDFVVLLTSHENEYNWFSATEHRNIFVHTEDWEILTKKENKFGIAYQVIENIFQSLIGSSHEVTQASPNVHFKPIGCINDFCQDKETVVLKLKTADICQDCINAAHEQGVSNNSLLVFQSVLESLSAKFRALNVQNLVEPEPVLISKNGEITIGKKEINLEPLQKTLFIFFLTHVDGEILDNLPEYEDDFFKIYSKVKKGAERSKIKNLTANYLSPDSTFLSTKSSLNKSLKNQLGVNLADYYTIHQIDKVYKTRLTPNYLDIRPEF
jgi:hypothetical protein